MSSEELKSGDVAYQLIRLPHYERDLKGLRRLEPKLHDEVRKSIEAELRSECFDEMPGTGGWIKGRVASPSRNIGKSGGFRLIYLLFRFQRDIYLAAIYEYRAKADLSAEEKKGLKSAAEIIKRTYSVGGK